MATKVNNSGILPQKGDVLSAKSKQPRNERGEFMSSQPIPVTPDDPQFAKPKADATVVTESTVKEVKTSKPAETAADRRRPDWLAIGVLGTVLTVLLVALFWVVMGPVVVDVAKAAFTPTEVSLAPADQPQETEKAEPIARSQSFSMLADQGSIAAAQADSSSPASVQADVQFVDTLPQEVIQQLTLLGYSSFEAFASDWGLRVGFDMASGQVDPRELTVCPFELNGCIRIIREKDQFGNILPYYISTSSKFACWHDGWRRESGQVRPGGYIAPERSGIYAGFAGLVEGVTIRKCRQQDGTSGTLPTAGVSQPNVPVNNPLPTAVPGSISNVTVQTNLNVRSGPGTQYPVVGTMTIGQQVQEIERVNDNGTWIKIAEGRWIAGWLTSAKDTSAPAVQQPAATAVPQGGQGGSSFSEYGITVLEGSPAFKPCDGNALCWLDQTNPVLIKFDYPQNGEYLPNGKGGAGASPIPVGTWWVTGVTLYPGGVK